MTLRIIDLFDLGEKRGRVELHSTKNQQTFLKIVSRSPRFFLAKPLWTQSGGLFGVWYRGIFTQHRLKQNTRHRWTFHRPTNPGVKPRFRLSPELKELLVWISYST